MTMKANIARLTVEAIEEGRTDISDDRIFSHWCHIFGPNHLLKGD